MKNKLFFILIFSLISVQTFSQIKFGIRGGINSYRVKFVEFENSDYRITVPKDATMGLHFGFISQIELFNLFIQPELLFTSNKNDIIIEDLISNDEQLTQHKFNKLDIPVLVGAKLGALKIGVGPVGSILLRSKSELFKITEYEQKFNNMTFGFQAGVGLDIGKLTVDLKYEGNLSKFGNGLTFQDHTFDFDQRPKQIIFSIGLFL